jgi:hypothetical protein
MKSFAVIAGLLFYFARGDGAERACGEVDPGRNWHFGLALSEIAGSGHHQSPALEGPVQLRARRF